MISVADAVSVDRRLQMMAVLVNNLLRQIQQMAVVSQVWCAVLD